MIARLGSRAWVLAGVVAGAAILGLAWMLLISPVRSDATTLREDTASLQTQNAVIQAQNNKLRDQAANQQDLVAQLEAALRGLPSGAGLPVFSRQLATQAAAHGLTLTGVSIGTPITATASDPTAPADPTAATTAPAAIPVTVTVDGPALEQLEFLRDVQEVGPRLALVTSTSLDPGQGADQNASIDAATTMTLQVTVFTNPQPKQTREQLAQLTGAVQPGKTGNSDDTTSDSADQG